MKKTKWDNDVTNYAGLAYIETKIQLSRPILLGVVYDQNQKGQQCDQLYRHGLHKKRNWVVLTN